MGFNKNECYKAEITGITADGNGVARIDGFAVFVPETAIGDYAEIKLVKVNKNYGYGRVEHLITPSPDRITPDCPCHLQCGGCTYRHISYTAECALKQDMVEQVFARIGGIEVQCNPIMGCEQVDGYRNKAQYPVASDGDRLISGFYAKRSHRVINSTQCRLQSDEFEQIKAAVLDFAQTHNIPAYNEVDGTGVLRHIYIRKAYATGEVMVCPVIKGRLPQEKQLVATLTASFPQIKSIVVNTNNKETNVILGDQCRTIYGNDFIEDVICGIRVRISAQSFYQVNRDQAERLYNYALDRAELTPNDTLLDLYCGTGTIGLIAASRVKQVIGVEIIPQAIENARTNAAINNITNAEFICADATTAATDLAARGIKPDVIVVDPPRKGLTIEVVEAIAQMAPSRVVMVSCNPATAARDVKLLCEHGYTAKQVQPVDLFPRTGHVEVIAELRRK